MVDDLIQYYRKELETPVSVSMYDHYYNQALTEMKWRDSAIEAVADVLNFENNQIWPMLAERIAKEDPTLAVVSADLVYPDSTIESVVTVNLQTRITAALESL